MLDQYESEVKEPEIRRALEPQRHSVLAEIAIAEKRPGDAIRELWKSDSFPDGPSSDCAHCIYASLGRMFDLADSPDSAIYYWSRFVSDSAVRSPSRDAVILAGTYKRLGELYEAKGDLKNALRSYEAFVELWKNADPELQPKVQQVRKRIALLRSREAK